MSHILAPKFLIHLSCFYLNWSSISVFSIHYSKFWGRNPFTTILRKVTLDLSKVSFFSLKFFLNFVFMKQKLGMFSFIISYLKSKKHLKSKLEMV